MIQIRLWNDCGNNCDFCSLGKKDITAIQDKRERINKLVGLSDDRIGLISGEFFEGQLYGCEKEWLTMIESIRCKELFITANFIFNPYLFEETVKIRPDILFCTSYDSVGRFKNDKLKEEWLARVNSLDNVFCTIIPTQNMIEDDFIDRIKCRINLCEPHLGLEWYSNVDKHEYHKHLIEDNKIFNLPRRNDLLQWIFRRDDILLLMKNYKANHFSSIFCFDKNNNLIPEYRDRFKDNNFIAECGHPCFSRCYADSDRCLICDLEEL